MTRKTEMVDEMDFFFPEDFIKKSHYLIFSKIKLSRRAQDIFALFLGRLQGDDQYIYQDFSNEKNYTVPSYTFSIPDLCQWLEVKEGSIYHMMNRIGDELTDQKIGISSGKKQEFAHFNLFDHAKFENAQFTMRSGHGIFPVIVDYTTKGIGRIKHKPFRALKNVHAKRIYELLSRFKDEDKDKLWPIKIEILHAMLGLRNEAGKLTTKSYENANLFIKRCLIEPFNEIAQCEQVNDHLQLLQDEEAKNLGFSVIKTGRKITAIKFLYRWVEPVDSARAEQSTPEQEQEQQGEQIVQSIPTSSPLIETYKDAWQIVMSYPHRGELNEKHEATLNIVKLGLALPIPNYPYNSAFEARLKMIQQSKNKH